MLLVLMLSTPSCKRGNAALKSAYYFTPLSLGGWKRFTEPFLMSGQVSGVYAMLMWIDVDVVNEINAFPG